MFVRHLACYRGAVILFLVLRLIQNAILTVELFRQPQCCLLKQFCKVTEGDWPTVSLPPWVNIPTGLIGSWEGKRLTRKDTDAR